MQTLGGRADDTYTAADVDPPKPNMKAGFDRADSDNDVQQTILDAIERGLIRDGDMLEMGNPRWALERGYADIGPVDGYRRGRLTEKGKVRLAELNGEVAPDAAGSDADARDNAPPSQPIEDFGEKLEGAREGTYIPD
ncbi:hypothetical protein [Parasphingorhabdus sp.]|uniref:hypothetical protein n=1 Tax=Parasphingorhabdus sp. TaxID=2709688 RepID=UPI0030014265